MKNLFKIWHQLKQNLAEKKDIPYFHEREVWFCCLRKNIGFEQDGKGDDFRRPVLTLKKYNKHCFLGVSLTSRSQSGKYYMEISPVQKIKRSIIILSQVRLLDSKRLISNLGKIPIEEFDMVKQKIIEINTL